MIKKVIKSKEEIYKEVSNIYIKELADKPNIKLGLATGSSPVPLYNLLIKAYENKEISFLEVTSFNLDEYIGLDKNDKNSYHTFMNENLFSKVDIKEENTFFPPVDENLIPSYEKNLEKTGIDIQLLGLGSNGHIAFNEPGADLNGGIHIVDLAQKTIIDNSRFFDKVEDVPTKAVTMGLRNIMDAKKVILIAIGKEKSDIIKEIFSNDEITSDIPATILKKHKDVTFYMDFEAAKYLN